MVHVWVQLHDIASIEYENTGLPTDECVQGSLIGECRLADLSSSHSTLPL